MLNRAIDLLFIVAAIGSTGALIFSGAAFINAWRIVRRQMIEDRLDD